MKKNTDQINIHDFCMGNYASHEQLICIKPGSL